MRILVLMAVAILAGCTSRGGRGEARWTAPTGSIHLAAAASGAWCPESRTLLVQASEADRVLGFAWHYDTLRPDSFSLAPPAPVDSPAVPATAGLRYVDQAEIMGYQSVSGYLRVSRVDTSTISAHLDAMMLRVGRTDSTRLTADFRRVPLVRDTTLCAR
jgi:hypothetical protein